MNRSGLFTNAAIAAVLVVPALTLQGHTPGSLQAALDSTLQALDVLAGIEKRVADGDRGAVAALLESTEASLPDARARDEALVDLRSEVWGLERELDGLHGEGEPDGGRPPEGLTLHAPGVAPTVGLDDETRRLLSGATRTTPPTEDPTTPAPQVATEATPKGKQSFEEPGYTADVLRLARAYYRQGRWSDALALLEGRNAVPAETYWRARCLEKLGRNTEAIADFERVIAHPEGGWEAQRAREDLDFLRWRMKFMRSRADAETTGDTP